MKRLLLTTLGLTALGVIIGCGGGGGSLTNTSSVSGVVEASLLKGVNVCVANSTNCVVTDENGKFKINTSIPANLEVRVGNSVIGMVEAKKSEIEVTPLVLANNDSTLAAYVGAMMHIVAGCDLDADNCDLSSIKSVDIDENTNKPIVEELKEKLATTTDIPVKVDNKVVTITDENVTSYVAANPEMTSNVLSYVGMSYPEGMLEFNIDLSTLGLEYKVIDFSGNTLEEGKDTLVNKFNNVIFNLQDSKDLFFVSSALATHAYMDDGSVYYDLGFQMPKDEIDETLLSSFINKNYVLVYLEGAAKFLGAIDLNSSDVSSLRGTYTFYTPESVESGEWSVDGKYLKFYESDGSLVAYGILRKGVSKNSIMLLSSDMSGFGLGIESKPISASDISGVYYYISYDFDGSELVQCYGSVNVDSTNVTFKDEYCSNNEKESGNAKLVLNPNINGIVYNGVAQIDGSDEVIFFDPETSMYMLIGTSESYSLSFGTKKPIK